MLAIISVFAVSLLAVGGNEAQRPAVVDVAPAPVDQSAALQAFIDAGTTIPPGTYPFATPLQLSPGKSLVGSGPGLTLLTYTGPPTVDGAIRIPPLSWGWRVSGINLAGGKAGTGIRCGYGAGGAGSSNGSAVLKEVWLSDFAVGIHFGDQAASRAVSEVVYEQVITYGCDTGVLLEDWNTLNHNFTLFGCVNGQVGIQCTSAGHVHVRGGSATNVGTVFVAGASEMYTLRDFRAEVCGYLLTTATVTSRHPAVIEGCTTGAITRPDKVDVLVRNGGTLTIRDCTLEGNVRYEGTGPNEPPQGYGQVVLSNVATMQPAVLTWRVPTRAVFEVHNGAVLDVNYGVRVRTNTVGQTPMGSAGKFPVNIPK